MMAFLLAAQLASAPPVAAITNPIYAPPHKMAANPLFTPGFPLVAALPLIVEPGK